MFDLYKINLIQTQDMIPSSVARTEKQNIAPFLSNIARNIATDLKQNFNPEM
jgi:hypothetical protein